MVDAETKKTVKNWVVGALIAGVVLIASTTLILNLFVNNLVAQVAKLNTTIGQRELELAQQQEKLAALTKAVSDAEVQLNSWTEKVGPLIRDERLTADVRRALEALRDLPSEKRDFVLWMADEPERMAGWFAPVVIGLENIYSHTDHRDKYALTNIVMPAYNTFNKYDISHSDFTTFPAKLKRPAVAKSQTP